MSTTVEVLQKGWTKGDYGRAAMSKHCLVGAACEAYELHLNGGIDYDTEKVRPHLTKVLDRIVPGWRDDCYSPHSIESWNDMPERTLEEVLLVAKHFDHDVEDVDWAKVTVVAGYLSTEATMSWPVYLSAYKSSD